MTVLSTGNIAAEWLSRPRSTDVLTVIACFEHCLYVALDNDKKCQSEIDICCVGLAKIGRGPLNVVASNDFSRVIQQARVGDRVWVIDDQLIFTGDGRLSIREAPVYTANLKAISNSAVAADRLSLSLCSSLPPGLDTALHRTHAQGLMAVLSRYLKQREHTSDCAEPLIEDICGLLGLGAGLTPAGDDFLCGVVLTLCCLHDQARFVRLNEFIVENARDRTNRISAAHLKAAAIGECGEAMAAMLKALHRNSPRQIEHAVSELMKVGGTSGHDALCGVYFALTETAASDHC